MSAPQPTDPLDEPISQFVGAVKAFLSTPSPDVEKPTPVDTGNKIDDLKKNWSTVIDLTREVVTGALPEISERLHVIITVGEDILALTDDPNIVGPVENLTRLASAQRDDVEEVRKHLPKAKSLFGAIAFLAALTAMGKRNGPRKQQIEKDLDSLTAYYLLEGPPSSAA